MSRTNQSEYIDIENIDIVDYINKYTKLKYRGGQYEGMCPFHKEKSGSFKLKDQLFKCFGCGKSGVGVIKFVMEYNNCDYKTAFSIIEKDNVVVKTIINRSKKESLPIEIQFIDTSYTGKHLEYWKNFEFDSQYLESNNVFAVKEWAIGTKGNLRIVKPTKNEVVFAYWAQDIDKCKILRIGPEITSDMKWRNTAPNHYLWFSDKIGQGCDLGFIAKSVKDALVLKKLGYCSIATNNESAKTLLENNTEKINNLFKTPVMCWGADDQGVTETKIITEKTGWEYYNTPKHLYEQYNIEDTADLLNNGFSYNTLNQLIKQKLKI